MTSSSPDIEGSGGAERRGSRDTWTDPDTAPLPVYRDRDLPFAPLAVQRERTRSDAAAPGGSPPLGAREVRPARPSATSGARGAAALTAPVAAPDAGPVAPPVTEPGTAAETPPQAAGGRPTRPHSARRTFVLGLVVGALVIVAVLAVLLAGVAPGLPGGAPGGPGAVPGGVTSMLPGHGAAAPPRAGG